MPVSRWNLSVIPISAIVGHWYFCDDGWMGELTLTRASDGSLAGTFYSDRFEEEYRVTAEVAGLLGNEITIAIHDFNWLPEQRFAGHLFTLGHSAFAGASDWRGIPYGFFAGRTPWTTLGEFRSGAVVPEDFAGSWSAQLDGLAATVHLELDADRRTLRGRCFGSALAQEYEVVGEPGSEVPHQVMLRIGRPEEEPWAVLSGYLNSGPKNAISGSMENSDGRRGFYLIRYA